MKREKSSKTAHTHTQFCFCFVQLELARAFTARSYTHSRIHPSREEAFWYTRWTVQPHTWNTTHAAVYASFSAKHTPKSATANCVVDSVLRYSLRSAEILGHHLSFVRITASRKKLCRQRAQTTNNSYKIVYLKSFESCSPLSLLISLVLSLALALPLARLLGHSEYILFVVRSIIVWFYFIMVAAFFHSFLAVSFTRHLTMFLIKILSSFSVCLILICSVALVAVFGCHCYCSANAC